MRLKRAEKSLQIRIKKFETQLTYILKAAFKKTFSLRRKDGMKINNISNRVKYYLILKPRFPVSCGAISGFKA